MRCLVMVNKTGRRRPSLGGVASTRPKTESLVQASEALKRMESVQGFIDKDQRDVMYISPGDIQKTFNARFIPCSLQEFTDINWPDTSETVEAAQDQYPSILSGHVWFDTLSDNQKTSFYQFLTKVHHTAQSMVELLQAQPITLERENEADQTFYIVDGERRTLSCLYTKGKIPVIKAQVFNRRLTHYERAMLKDVANTGEPLTTFENIRSKAAIYNALPEAPEMNLRDLGKLLRISKNQAGWFKMLMTHPEQADFYKRIEVEQLGWRQIKYLLDNGIKANIVTPAKTSKDAPVSTPVNSSVSHGVTATSETTESSKTRINSDILRLQNMISEQVGYACQIRQKDKNKKVQLSFEVSMDDFEHLLANLKPVDLNE